MVQHIIIPNQGHSTTSNKTLVACLGFLWKNQTNRKKENRNENCRYRSSSHVSYVGHGFWHTTSSFAINPSHFLCPWRLSSFIFFPIFCFIDIPLFLLWTLIVEVFISICPSYGVNIVFLFGKFSAFFFGYGVQALGSVPLFFSFAVINIGRH